MYEQSKAVKRRFNDGAFHTRYFVGSGIDVGAGPDSLKQYVSYFAILQDVYSWDKINGDAMRLDTVQDETYDFLTSSHCLEHLDDPHIAIQNWLRVVKRGGHLILLLPDFMMYEGGKWPSRYGEGHKWAFTLDPISTTGPVIHIMDLLRPIQDRVSIERLQIVRDFYDFEGFHPHVDQTMRPNVECGIEVILRRTT